MAVETTLQSRSESAERRISRLLSLSPYAAARILTNKLDLQQALTPDELQPGKIPETSTLLRDKAHESWLSARQQADRERAAREYSVNGQTKRYQEMGLDERVDVWARDVMEIVQDEIQQNTVTWMEGFTALGFHQESDASLSQTVVRLRNFFATDFYTRYCMTAEDNSAEAIARNMVRYFIEQKSPQQREQGVDALLQTWETMQPLFGQMLDETTRQDVEFILQAQAQRALGNITPDVANQTPSLEDVPVLVRLHRHFVPQENEDQVRDRILQLVQHQPVPLENPDALAESAYETVPEPAEGGGEDIEEEQHGAKKPDKGKVASGRRAARTGGQTANSITNTRTGERVIGSLLPPPPQRRPVGPVIVPVVSPISRPASVVPFLEPSTHAPAANDSDKAEERGREVEVDKATQLLVAYMHARTAAYVLEAQLSYLRNEAIHVPEETAGQIWIQHKNALERGPRTILTEDELTRPEAVDAILERYSTNTILEKPFSVARKVTQEWLTRHQEDIGKNAQGEFQERANLAFAQLPRQLEALTKVGLWWGNVDSVLMLLDQLLKRGYKASYYNEITGERMVYSREDLAAQANYLAQVPIGELAFYIQDIFGLGLMKSA